MKEIDFIVSGICDPGSVPDVEAIARSSRGSGKQAGGSIVIGKDRTERAGGCTWQSGTSSSATRVGGIRDPIGKFSGARGRYLSSSLECGSGDGGP